MAGSLEEIARRWILTFVLSLGLTVSVLSRQRTRLEQWLNEKCSWGGGLHL